MFPFDEGRQYDVVLDAGRLPAVPGKLPGGRRQLAAVVGRPAVVRSPSTVVTHIYPSGDIVPANQLRMYLHFSAPMDWRSGYDYVMLLDDRGQEVVDAFLPLDADFWNDDRTRYTVFFDPGRVKRGILPNKQMGRALEAGQALHAARQARVAGWARPAAQGRVPARVPRQPGDRAAACRWRRGG